MLAKFKMYQQIKFDCLTKKDAAPVQTQTRELNCTILFSEPTRLLVSAKTQSSGTINFQTLSPRFQDFRFHGTNACLGFKHGIHRKS